MSRLLRCSFCQKPEEGVEVLLRPHLDSAQRVYICDECVSICQRVLEEELREQAAVKAPDGEYAGDLLRCSFCQKTNLEVQKLIGSAPDHPRAYVCNECVSASQQLLQDGSRDCVGAVSRVPQRITPEPVRNNNGGAVKLAAWVLILAIIGLVLLAIFSALR